MEPTAVEAIPMEDLEHAASGEFHSIFESTFGLLLENEGSPIFHEEALRSLRKTFEGLSTDGGANMSPLTTHEYVACLRCPEVDVSPCKRGEAVVLVEKKSEYYILKSVEILGNEYMRHLLYEEAYICYKLAYIYYADRFDRYFVKSRLMKKKVVKSLLEMGRFEDILNETLHDVYQNSYGTALDAEATVFIKYAYGRSLLTIESFREALPHLTQPQLGDMDTEVEENMELLLDVFRLAHENLSQSNVIFALSLAERLLNAFGVRLMREDCPAQVFEFASSFAGKLWAKNLNAEFSKLRDLASTLHSDIHSSDSRLLLWSVDCSSSIRRQSAIRGMRRYHLMHARGAADAPATRRINVGSTLLYNWEAAVDFSDQAWSDESFNIEVTDMSHVSPL